MTKSHCDTCTCFKTVTRIKYIYKTWDNIKSRCFNTNNPDYKDYGGRGISIHEDWRNNYKSFEKYILDHLGERPIDHSLDRINNDGSYVPGNLKWSTYADQVKNRRTPIRSKQVNN